MWRIGYEKVEWLENNDHEIEYSVEYLKRIKRIFTKKYKKIVDRF